MGRIRAMVKKMTRAEFVRRTAPGASRVATTGVKMKGTGKAWRVGK